MPSDRAVRQMKWWGWGDESIAFDPAERPGVLPYVEKHVGLAHAAEIRPPVSLDTIALRAPREAPGFLEAIGRALRTDQVVSGKLERVIHSYGKSFRDLWRVRQGMVDNPPDWVIYPETEEDVVAVIAAAATHGVVVVPFGAGSNITGCVEPSDRQGRPVVSLDMKRMDRVLAVDTASGLARIQAGALGPRMEEQLATHGFTLGHFPDSFQFSTLGGWIATRSAGMQSDKYGKIEDMVVALRVVTPSGTIVTRTVPRAASGIDLNHLCIGSEGTLGVITEATMRVHPHAPMQDTRGYLFRSFADGIAAMRDCVAADCLPSMTRVNDPGKTSLSFAFRPRRKGLARFTEPLLKKLLGRIHRLDFETVCLTLTTYEGTAEQVRRQRREVEAIYRRHGAVCLGSGPGRSFQKAKYDFPYTRDFLMDRGLIADVSETATTWSNLMPMYEAASAAVVRAMAEMGAKPWVGCHLSHSYRTGASLYFTFACKELPGRTLEQYLRAKKAIQDCFLAQGGTLSHHHAVGLEHLPWLEDEVSPAGLRAVAAIKQGVDPVGIMNPGKLVAGSMAEWGLPGSGQP